METDNKARRLRTMSDPTDLFQMDKEVKKSGGISHFFHIKLPFLSGKHHRHHNGHSLSDDEFCDIETEMKKPDKREKLHHHGHKKAHQKKHKDVRIEEEEKKEVVVMVNDGTDTETDHRKEVQEEVEDGKAKVQSKTKEMETEQNNSTGGSGDAVNHAAGDTINVKEGSTCENNLLSDEEGSLDATELEVLHEPPLSPLPPPPKSCLKHKTFFLDKDGSSRPPPLRKRSISMPEGDPNIIFRLNRHVHFSPDTVEPTSRNCKYREWIERHSSHGCVKSNIRHEKRMQQLVSDCTVNAVRSFVFLFEWSCLHFCSRPGSHSVQHSVCHNVQ